jgi:hypothetical protein
MRSTKLFTVSVAASFLLGSAAHAADSPSLPWSVGGFHRVPVAGSLDHPELNWTSVIGTGTAASIGRGIGSFQRIPLVNVPHQAEPDWTATIGTGAAAFVGRRM